MDEGRLIKREMLRLNAGSWRRKNFARRWELMCVLREQGKSWKEMGTWIGLHWTTAQRHYRRGMAERRKLVPRPGNAPSSPG